MIRMKSLYVSLLALSLSAPAFADCCPWYHVSIPNQQGGLTVGVDALWLQPNADNLTVATVENQSPAPLPTPSITTRKYITIDPSMHLAWNLTAAYRFCGTGNDVSVAWTHLGETSDSKASIQPPIPFGFESVGSRVNDDHVKFNYDAIDFDVGQRINLGCAVNLRLFTGLRWAQLEENIYSRTVTTVVSPEDPTVTVVVDDSSRSKYSAVGPQLGFEGRYCLGYGFGVDAGTTGSLLVGRTDTKQSSSIVATINGAPPEVDQNTLDESELTKKCRIVPAIDANLGLDYTYNFNNCSRSSLTIQAGYKIIHYWGVANHISLFSEDEINHGANVSFNGPYVGVKVNL